MPGIVGFTRGADSENGARETLRQMQKLVIHQDFYGRDDLFVDKHVCAARAHTRITQKLPQPYREAGTYVWLDGEFYNQDELRDQIEPAASTDPALLLSLYRQHDDFSFLKKIDGVYSAAIYDSKQQKLHLISDRYGFRHLYWTVHRGSLAWGSEFKAMMALPSFEPKIDQRALEDFFDLGYLLEDRTWFECVELLPGGTVLTWDIEEQSSRTQRYWCWDEIKPLAGRIDEAEIVEELGRLFINAVERRCHAGERIGLTLSGGLDSRAILASMPDLVEPIHAVTFGKAGCDDLRIADMAAQVKGAFHHTVEINSNNWLRPRLDAVWWTDGQLDLKHMHGIEAIPIMRRLFDTNLSGILARAVLGGAYLGDPRFSETAKLENRGRRFVVLGLKTLGIFCESRLPFFDNELAVMALSIPESMRRNSHIYRKMLLREFPEYYGSIPWQKTGIPISWPHLARKAFSFFSRVEKKLLRETNRLGFNFSNRRRFHDYPYWIRQEPARSSFREVLMNSDALYPEYISRKQVCSDWEKHLTGQNHADYLCRYLTFEIWLQQVFEGKYLPIGG